METNREDRIEELTLDAQEWLRWNERDIRRIFRFDVWHTLPTDEQWNKILDQVCALEWDDEFPYEDFGKIIAKFVKPVSPAELRSTRLALGLSQGSLAELLGVAQSTVHRWERGQRATPADLRPRLTRLCFSFTRDITHERFDRPWGEVARFWATWGFGDSWNFGS